MARNNNTLTPEQFFVKVKAVADLMGYEIEWETWQQTNDTRVTIRQGDKAIWITYGGWDFPGKIKIRAVYPSNFQRLSNYRTEENISINVSQDKTPEQIAKDIERRLMPTYLEVLPEVLKKNQSDLDKHNQTVANLRRVALKIGVQDWEYDDRSGEQRGYQVSTYNTSVDKYLGRIRGYDDEIVFEARLDIETALKVIDVLQQTRIFVCANCDYKGEYDTLPRAKDIGQRHDPGDTYSDVECPRCGALCFPDKTTPGRIS